MARFNQSDVNELLSKCHRRCCVCHRYCGVKIELDHMIPRAEGGSDSIDNAIAVCFECHAEIHSYNDQHPRGRKFRPEELRRHKEQWLHLCEVHPEIFINASRDADVGPLQALIDELDFNSFVSEYVTQDYFECLFLDNQFRRAMQDGVISTLQNDVKQSILAAYRTIGIANPLITKATDTNFDTVFRSGNVSRAIESIERANRYINEARNKITALLGSEDK